MSALVLEVKNAKSILKEEGVRALFKKYGWKLFAIVFTYYLMRDLTLYVLIPALIIKHF